MSRETPRVKFCWHCGRKLRGNSFVEQEIDGHDRTLHKECAKSPEQVKADYDLLSEDEQAEAQLLAGVF